ncbi:hypothetical protein F0562_003260 [Nyssa sinensis]|uniref:Uncharacterized protein n=1 Tax=Nyssa sinensis TaxID=561372 RepID=A0A5J5BVV4_9ASTE|nr:hypothetical protein F0562_003260 [Nyssa sinensis]
MVARGGILSRAIASRVSKLESETRDRGKGATEERRWVGLRCQRFYSVNPRPNSARLPHQSIRRSREFRFLMGLSKDDEQVGIGGPIRVWRGDVAAGAIHGDFLEQLVLREQELGLDVEDCSSNFLDFPFSLTTHLIWKLV